MFKRSMTARKRDVYVHMYTDTDADTYVCIVSFYLCMRNGASF